MDTRTGSFWLSFIPPPTPTLIFLEMVSLCIVSYLKFVLILLPQIPKPLCLAKLLIFMKLRGVMI